MFVLIKSLRSFFPRHSLHKRKALKAALKILYGEPFLYWLINIVDNRLRYKLNALYQGILMNRQSLANADNFRRNIHRLEKGLSYLECKSVFAEKYIQETVSYLQEDNEISILDRNTRMWGESVLDYYFQICESTEKIASARKLYRACRSTNEYKGWIPYLCKSRPKLTIDYNSFYQLSLRRRSIRSYLSKEVESHLIEKALRIAILSPSACNRQSFKFLFFNQKDFVKKISEIPGGVSGYEIPSIAVVVGRYRGYFDERDINAPIIDSSLFVMAFLFALETLNLASVCINWPNLPDREEKIRKLIHLERDEFIVMLIGIGYPSPEGKIPYSAKKETGSILLVNQRMK